MSKTEKKEPAIAGSPTPKKKKRGRKSTRMYFTHDTELAIGEYLASNNEATRNKIFNDRINYSFYKLAENLIHTFKFYYTEVESLEDLKHEVVCFLLEKLHYFDPTKGSKAFSYFSIVGKNYLILYNNTNSVPSNKPKNASKADKIQRKSKAVNEANNPNLSAATLGVIDSFFNED